MRHASIRHVARRVLGHSFTGSFGLRWASLAIGLGVNVLLARLLGPTEFGAYAFALTVITLIAVPLHSGVAMMLVREVARDVAAGAWGKLSGVLRAANFAVIVVFGAVLIVAVFVLWWQHVALGQEVWLWVCALGLLPFYSMASVRGAVLRGLHRPVLGQMPDLILRPAILGLGLLLVALVAHPSARTAMALHVVAALCAFVVGSVLLMRLLPSQVRQATPEYTPRVWLRSVLPFSLITGIQVINSSLAVLFLGHFGTKADIGFYRVADLGASLVALGLVAGDIVLAPRIAAMHARGNQLALQTQVTTMTRIMLAAALPVALVTTVLGGAMIHLLFGDLFLTARWPLVVLSLGQLVNVATGSVGSLLTMTGHEREALRAVAATTLLNLVLGALLIPAWGALGAAFASSVTLVVLNLSLMLRVKHLTGIRSGPW